MHRIKMEDVSPFQIARMYESLEALMRHRQMPMSIEEMLELTEDVEPSKFGIPIFLTQSWCMCVVFVSVGNGGMLFEFFLTTSASYTLRRKWATVRQELKDDPSKDMSEDFAELLREGGTSFFFHVLSTLASRGRAAQRQLFYMSLVMQHKGLSRSGLLLLSNMNLGLSPRTFDLELQRHAIEEEEDNRWTH